MGRPKKVPALQVVTIGPGATVKQVAESLGIDESVFWRGVDSGRILLICVRAPGGDDDH